MKGVDIDDNSIASATDTNLRLAYGAEVGMGEWEFFANVENLFDRDPQRAPGTFSGFNGAAHTNSLFDQLGRRYTVGLNYSY